MLESLDSQLAVEANPASEAHALQYAPHPSVFNLSAAQLCSVPPNMVYRVCGSLAGPMFIGTHSVRPYILSSIASQP